MGFGDFRVAADKAASKSTSTAKKTTTTSKPATTKTTTTASKAVTSVADLGRLGRETTTTVPKVTVSTPKAPATPKVTPITSNADFGRYSRESSSSNSPARSSNAPRVEPYITADNRNIIQRGLDAARTYVHAAVNPEQHAGNTGYDARTKLAIPIMAAGVLGGGAASAAGGVGALGSAAAGAVPRIIPAVTSAAGSAARTVPRIIPAAASAAQGVARVASNVPTSVKVGVPVLGAGVLAAKETGLFNGGATVQDKPIATVDPASNPALTQPGAGGAAGGGNQMRAGGARTNHAAPAANTGYRPSPGPLDPNDPNIVWGNGQPGAAQPEQPINQMQPEMPDFNQMQADLFAQIDALTNQNAVLSATYLDQMTSSLDSLQSQIMQMYQQQGTEIDPATQAALKSLRDQVTLRRQGLMEDMNRRGLLQSGIWLEEENKILNNQLDAESQMLATRLSDMQNRMADTLMSFASQRMNIMNTSMQNAMSSAQWAAGQKISAATNVANQQMDWNQWWADQQTKARQAAQEQANWQAEYDLDKARTDYDTNKPYYNPNSSSGATKPTQTEKDRNSLADAYTSVATAKKNGKTNAEVEASIRSQTADLVRAGVDPQKVIDYLYSVYPESTGNSNWLSNLFK